MKHLIITIIILTCFGVIYSLSSPNLEREVPQDGRTLEIVADIAINPVQGKLIRVTAYCPCEKCCGEWSDGQTASGYWIQPGDRFVAAPKHIPFGTKLIVPGYNEGKPVEVKDRGGAITVERLDVYFDTHQEALNWGVKYLAIRAVEGE